MKKSFLLLLILVFVLSIGYVFFISDDEQVNLQKPSFSISEVAFFMTFSPDGKKLAVSGPTEWKIIDIETKQIVQSKTHTKRTIFHNLVFSQDGKLLAATNQPAY